MGRVARIRPGGTLIFIDDESSQAGCVRGGPAGADPPHCRDRQRHLTQSRPQQGTARPPLGCGSGRPPAVDEADGMPPPATTNMRMIRSCGASEGARRAGHQDTYEGHSLKQRVSEFFGW
jgi:hypothetical protein